jgi:hypothetical protein
VWFRLGTASCELSVAITGCNYELSEGLEDWADDGKDANEPRRMEYEECVVREERLRDLE